MNDNAVTLKVNNRAFKCDVKTSTAKTKCGSPDFYASDYSYQCAKCGASHPMGPHVLANAPLRNDWRTPGGSIVEPAPLHAKVRLWTRLHEEYHFNVDLAASIENAKCPLYFDAIMPETDALLVPDWRVAVDYPESDERAEVRGFGNPPYNPRGEIQRWLTKAVEQCALGAFSAWLLPMASSVDWFNDLVIPFAEWHTFNGRVAFEDPLADESAERTSPKQDNVFVIYDPASTVVGHTAVRDPRTGEYLWRRP